MKRKKIDCISIGSGLGKLVQDKQLAYGDSFGRAGECLRQMYPNGIKPTQYDDVLTIARILDKLFRIANAPQAFGENPYNDIGGYSILGCGRYSNLSDKKDETINENKRRKFSRRTKQRSKHPKKSARTKGKRERS